MTDGPGLGPVASAALARAESVLGEVLPLRLATERARAALVERKVAALGDFVSAHVPFYTGLGLPPQPRLCDFPPVEKARLMLGLPGTCAEPDVTLEDLRRYVPTDERDRVEGLFRGRYYVRRTSGTTGVVGFFLWDEPAAATVDAAQARFIPRLGDLPKPLVAVSPVIAIPPVAALLQGMHTIPISAGIEGAVERLNRLRPRSLIGSPAFMASVAGEQLAGRLRINPEAVLVWTERCLPNQRRMIQEAWGIDAAEPYGTSETSAIAVRCQQGNFHVLGDTVHLELLDEQGNEVAEGQAAARVLVTRLCGPVQPVIRYELGDVLVRGPEACPCGWPFPTLAEVHGRQQARLWLPARAGGVVDVSAFVLIPVIESTPGLVRYQLRHDRPGLLEVAVVIQGVFDGEGLRACIAVVLERAGVVPPEIRLVAGELPTVWAAPPGTKDHHVRLAVTREEAERDALSSRRR